MKKVYISYPLGDEYMKDAAMAREICAAAFRLFGLFAICPAALFEAPGTRYQLAEAMGPCTEAWFFHRDESCQDEIEQAERMGIPILEKVATVHDGLVEDITDASEDGTQHEGQETPRARLQRVFISMGRKTGKTVSTETVLDNMLGDILDAIKREWPEDEERVCLYNFKKGKPADILHRQRATLSKYLDYQNMLNEIRSMTGPGQEKIAELERLAKALAKTTGKMTQDILELVRRRVAEGSSLDNEIANMKRDLGEEVASDFARGEGR